jgi:hypothetical protein
VGANLASGFGGGKAARRAQVEDALGDVGLWFLLIVILHPCQIVKKRLVALVRLYFQILARYYS